MQNKNKLYIEILKNSLKDFFMLRFLKLLIETNLFIAITAVCFMWANMYFLDIIPKSIWILSAQVFFSTWFVYQISRWIYFIKGEYANKGELVIQWFEKYPTLNQITIYGSGILAVFFTLFLSKETIFVLCIIGIISVLYPIPILKPFGINTRLRDFPFIKIFLIAFVWSITSVVLPFTESNYNKIQADQSRQILFMFLTQFMYILFITLPFDINDAEIDKTSKIKTIPSVLGIKASKIISLVLGVLYALALLFMFMLVNWNHMPNKYLSDWSISFIFVLILLLQLFTLTKSDKVQKWWIKIIYDGSMIVYFLIVYFSRLHS